MFIKSLIKVFVLPKAGLYFVAALNTQHIALVQFFID